MNLTVSPSLLTGTVTAPPSKSMTLRALAAAFLSKDEAVVRNPSVCGDVKNACDSLQVLGTAIIQKRDHLVVLPHRPKGGSVHCGESALWFRMMAPILSLFPNTFTLTAQGSLKKRPMEMMIKPLKELGTSVTASSVPPITVKGPLQPGTAAVDGSQTSQFISGLLFALPLLSGPSVLNITGLSSRPYIKMTMEFLAEHGIFMDMDKNDTVYLQGNQHYSKIDYTVEGDWSGSAFFLVAGALHGPVTVSGLDRASLQGDKAIIEILRTSGAVVARTKTEVTVTRGELRAFDYDATDTPDLVPPLAVLASCCRGTSHIRGMSRITRKESDRGAALQAMLHEMGVPVTRSEDLMAVTGASPGPGSVSSYGDHRIAMAASLLASQASGDVEVRGAEAVSKSYPSFFDAFRQLGGLIHE